MADEINLSFVVPVYNEEESLSALVQEIDAVCHNDGYCYEIVFINDGSTDHSVDVIKDLMAKYDSVGLIDFRRNFGKAAALNAGFRHVRGDIVITMDGDLQDNPNELPKLLKALESADCVSGWKVKRLDPVDKTLPSRIFNFVVGKVSGIKLHDFNCGYKAYRKEAVEGLDLYGEMHRFIPVLLHWQGFRVAEVGVDHRARQFGRSKYGATRILKGFFDLMTVVLTTRFKTRPLHIFGTIGLLFGFIGFCMLAYLTVLWFLGLGPIGNRPLLLFGMLLMLLGGNLIGIGLLGEFIQHAVSPRERPYVMRAYYPSRKNGEKANSKADQ
ncbi:MAG: glycosyltransferase family 2 protein [Alphaproteobacteria bacterium]|nr:glycosyltransferase family 2 protein [Alphaproteobacteria bacterium]